MFQDVEQNSPDVARPTGAFTGFGASRVLPATAAVAPLIDLPRDLGEARKLLREFCPRVPGVYGWLNQDQQIVYIGKSKSLRHRLLSYFTKHPSDPKMGRIRRAALRLTWEPIPHELLALLREQELIHRFRPEYNSQGQPTRLQPAFVCLSDSTASHAFVARRSTEKAYRVYGPILGTKYLRESVESLNHVFKLRDCPDTTKFQFSSQLRLFDEPARAKCIRHELGSCPAPCANLCSPGEYRENLHKLLRFLDGQDRSTLSTLEQQMIVAGQSRNFERAAILRNHWHALGRLDRQLHRLRTARVKINGVMQIPQRSGREVWLVFRHGTLFAAMLEPRSANQAAAAQAVIREAQRSSPTISTEILQIYFQIIVQSWFSKNRNDLQQLLALDDFAVELEQKLQRYQRRAS